MVWKHYDCPECGSNEYYVEAVVGAEFDKLVSKYPFTGSWVRRTCKSCGAGGYGYRNTR